MKKHTVEQKILAARPEDAIDKDDFVALTMRRVGDAKVNETFNKLLRTRNVTTKKGFTMKLSNIYARFKSLPRLVAAAILIGTPVTVGAAAYATYQWIIPKVAITSVQPHNDENKRQYTIDSECGDYRSGKGIKYELAQDSKLTDWEVQKIFENTCAYDALGSFIESKWHSNNSNDDIQKMKEGDIITIYGYQNMFGGSSDANPAFGITIGSVTAIDSKNVTFQVRQYAIDNSLSPNAEKEGAALYYPNGTMITRTLPIAPDAEVWKDGKMISLSEINVGDQIQVVTREQHKAKYYEDIKQLALGEQTHFDVIGIVKTNFDTRYIADDSSKLGDPSITNDLALLVPCENNTVYSCLQVPNPMPGIIYDAFEVSGTNQSVVVNKYLRKDHNTITQYYLTGRITDIKGTHVTLQTRGKQATINLDLPYDAISTYNQPHQPTNKSEKPPALPVKVGDMVDIMYSQKANEDHLNIKATDLQHLLLVRQVKPDGSYSKY